MKNALINTSTFKILYISLTENNFMPQIGITTTSIYYPEIL